MKCDKTSLNEKIHAFARFGKTKNGGVSRLTLTKPDIEARNYLIELMESIQLEISIDDLGNIYGKYQGTEDLPPIVLGSHGDSVEKGGNYDGILGVIAAYEVVKTLHEHQIKTRHPIIVTNFTNEEGVRFPPAMFSSGVLAGINDEETIFHTKDRDGISFKEALEKSPFNGSRKNRLGNGAAYIELHIEQGPVLDKCDKEIGIVQGIVGMCCYEITIKGESNHAGTTPMHLRKDSLMTATKFIDSIYNALLRIHDELVFTIGQFDVSPNLHTVIPKEVKFTLDMRHYSHEVLNLALSTLDEVIQSIQQTTNCEIHKQLLWERDTVHFDDMLINQVEESTKTLGYSFKKMFSGAGHDAQFLARMMPTTMIFIPSKDGKSHCEEEYSSLESCYAGVNVLLNTVLELDKKLNKKEK